MKRSYHTTNHFSLWAMMTAMGLSILFCVYSLFDNSLPIDTPFTEFQALQPETPLEETYYQIDYRNQNIDLKNTFTQVTHPIVQRYSPVALPPAYQLLRHNNRIYLLIRLASGGNSGAYWFKLFNISVSPVIDMMQYAVAPLSGLSCTYPQVDVDALEFEISPNCADSAAPRQSYEINLR